MKRVLHSTLCLTLIVFFNTAIGIIEANAAANLVTGVSVGSQTGTMCEGSTNAVSYTITLSCNNGNQNGSSVLSLTGTSLPTGVTASYSSGTFTVVGSTVTVAKNNTSGTVILTLTSSASSVSGTTTGITITTTNNAFTSSGFSLAISSNPGAVTVSGGGSQCGGSMTLTASGGSGGTIYWQNTTSNGTSTATPSTSQSVSSSGTYYFRAQSAGGCWGTQGSATVSILSSPSAPTATTHTPSATQIVWNWNSVAGASGYKWNTINDYASATDLGNVLTKTETGLVCETSYTRYIWAYNACGNSTATTFSSTTSTCPAMTVPTTGNNSYSVCSGNLYDSGGSAGDYATSSSGYTVLNPSVVGNVVSVSGTITSEAGYDYLTIYDGSGTGGTVLWGGSAHGSGTTCTAFTVPTTTSTSGSLTIKFYSDGSTNCAGFNLTITCITPCTPPTTQATAFSSSSITNNTMTVGWTRGTGDGVIVVAKAGSAPTDPENGTNYTANAAYGSGTACGGGFVVYKGTGTSVPITALSANTTYYFAIYEYMTTDVCYHKTELTGNATTCPTSVSLPQTCDFTSFTGTDLTTYFPNFSEATGATPSGTTSSWSSSTALTTTTAKVNLYSNTKNEWIMGPTFSATASTTISFKAAITDYNSGSVDAEGMQGTDDKVIVRVKACGGSWTDVYTFDASNTSGLSNVLTNYDISLSAYNGQTITVAIFAYEGTDNTPDYDFHIDDINIYNATGMTFSSSTVTQPNTTAVEMGLSNQEVICIQVVTTGVLSPLSVSSFTVNASGSTSITDINVGNAKIYYTANSSTFATTTLFGQTSPTIANYNITGTQTLTSGTNYFWLVYDISSSATAGNVVDAECSSVTVDGTPRTPTATDPAGTRTIVNRITIGTGTSTTSSAPVYTYYDYSRSATIYTEAELGTLPSLITTLAWNIATATTFNVPVKIYLKSTTLNEVPVDTWANMISGATLVYNNTTSFTPTGWKTFDITDFSHCGDNLMVLVEANIGSTETSTYFYYTTTSSYKTEYWYGTTAPTGTGYTTYSRPNIQIGKGTAGAMSYTSSAVTQANQTNVNPNSANQEILGLQIVTTGCNSALTASSFTFNTTGTTAAATDISNARLWTTGTSSTFATATPLGSAVASPSGSYTINSGTNLPYTLDGGTNYFWLTYDVPSGAVAGNTIDAQCTSVTVGSARTPSPTTIAGGRTIVNEIIVGTGTGTSSAPTPYRGLYEDAREQYIITAAELSAYGLYSGCALTSLAFNVSTKSSTAAYSGYNIKIGHTTQSTFSAATFLAPTFTQVYSGNYTSAAGWNTHSFSTNFTWNGTDNIVVQVCFDNNAYTSTDPVYYTATAGNTVCYAEMDASTGCSLTGELTSANRPNMKFTYNPGPACTGTPDAGSAGTTPQTICTGETASMSASGFTVNGSGVTFQWEKSADGSTGWAAVTDGLGGTTASYTSATLNTTSYYRCAVKCTATGLTDYTNVVTVNVTGVSSLIITEGFNTSGTTVFPSCWSQQTVSGASSFSFETTSTSPTATPYEGTRMVKWNSYSIASGNQTRLVSLPVTTSGTASVDVEFMWYHSTDGGASSYTTEGVQVQYSTDGVTWTSAGSFVKRYDATSGWIKKSVTLPAGAGNQSLLYVGFLFTSNTGYNCYLDKAVILPTPSCIEPTGLSVSGTTTTSATIVWTAPTPAPVDGYDVYYSTSSTAPTSGTTPSFEDIAALTKVIPGLTASTTYYIWVRSDCVGTDYSTWAGPVTAITACGEITSYPFTESFDGTTFTPTCWSNTQVSGTGLWARSTAGTEPTCATHSGAGMAYFKSYTYTTGVEAILVTPPLNLPANGYLISFWMYRDAGYSTNDERVNVYSNTTASKTGATLLGTVYRNTTLTPVVASAGWYQYTYSIPISGTGYIIFDAISDYGNNMFIDDINISAGSPMAYVSSTTTQTNTATVAPGSTSQEIIGVQVVTSGSSNPLTASSFTFNVTGSTNASTDILNATLWATGTSGVFATTTQLGAVTVGPTGSFTVTGGTNMPYTLSMGTNYFWLTYDIKATATLTNVVDAQCTSVTVGSAQTPTVQAPAGTRTIAAAVYCTPAPSSVDGTGITNVTCGTINNTTGAEAGNYGNYSAMSTDVYQGATVPISITYSTGYTYLTIIWIDWNNDGDFFDTGEEVYSGESLSANPTTLSASFAVPISAITGSHRMRIGGTDSNTPIPCYTGTWGTYEDYSINVLASAAMTFTSCTTTQNNTTVVAQGSFDQEIIGVQVVTAGASSPLTASSFTFNITGSTAAADIANATLWTSGLSSSFATATQLGAVVVSPTGSFTITGGTNLPYTLSSGTNYFWLTYDISATATIGNFVDAECTSVTVGSAQTPTVTAPAGTRKIDIVYCNPVYTFGCSGDYISNVTFSTINNTTACTGSLPSNLTYYSAPDPSLTQGVSYTLSVTRNSTTEGVSAWIDYNHDGVFASDELVLTGAVSAANPVSTSVVIPGAAVVGETRMRVRCAYNSVPSNACTSYSYGETEDYLVSIVAGCTPPTVSAISPSSATICSGADGGTFSLTISGGTAPYTYQWYKNGTLVSGATSATYSPGGLTANTTIYCKAYSNACAVDAQSPTASVYIETPSVFADVSATSACSGTTVLDLTGSPTGMSSYAWTGPSGVIITDASAQNTSVKMGTTSGVMTLTVTNSNGCTASANTESITVTSGVPICSTTPTPSSGATGVLPGAAISWSSVADATSYDVYFGTTASPSLVANVTSLTYTPSTVSGTTYYWKIVPRNGCGAATATCGTWNFQTYSCSTTGLALDPAGDGGFASGSTLAVNNWYATTSTDVTSTQFVCGTGATAGFTGTHCAYVSNNATGTPPHTYDKTRTRVTHLYRDFVIPAGASNIILDFNWIGVGEANKDYMKVWIVPSYYTPSYGEPIAASGTAPYGKIRVGSSSYSGQATWTNAADITLSNTYAGLTSVRVVFEWINDNNGAGTNPPFGVDNVSVTYDCPEPACAFSGLSWDASSTRIPAYDTELNDGILYIDACQFETLNITPLPAGNNYDWIINSYDGTGMVRYTNSNLIYPINYASGYDGYLVVDGAACYSMFPLRIRSSAGPSFEDISATLDGCAGSSLPVNIGSETTNEIEVEAFSGDINAVLGFDALTYIPDGPYCNICYESSVTFIDFPANSVVESADDILYLRVSMEHSNMAEIQIALVGPNDCGEAIILQDYYTTSNSPFAKDDDTYYYPYNLTDRIAFGVPYEHDLETSGQPCNPQSALNYQGTGYEYCWSNNHEYSYANGYVYSAENHVHTNGPFIEYTVNASNFNAGTNFYHPFENFSNLIGCPLNGEWSVRVCDSEERNNGWIFDWELGLATEQIDIYWSYDVELDHVTWNLPGVTAVAVAEQTDPMVYNLEPGITASGTYNGTFSVVDEFGCSITPNITYTVTPFPTITGILTGDYVWVGDDTGNWDNANELNWLEKTAASYATPVAAPTSVKNVFIVDYCALGAQPKTNDNVNCNNLTIIDGTLTVADATTLSISGNFDNQDKLIANDGSTVVFNGSAAQSVTTLTTGGESFYNLIFNNTGSGVTFAQDVLVRKELTMTRGNILTGTNVITLGTSTSNLGALNHTAGSVIGYIRRWFDAAVANSVVFPVGVATYYRPATISYPATAPTTGGTLTGHFQASDPGSVGLTLTDGLDDLIEAAPDGYWSMVTGDGLAGGIYNMDLAATGFGVVDYTGLHIIKRTNSSNPWTLQGLHQATSGTNALPVLHRRDLSGFSEFGVGAKDGALPVEIISFAGTCDNGAAVLEWTTASEINNDYFIIEKSSDLKTFYELGRVDGAGNSNTVLGYSMVDKKMFRGNNYYRLKQVDFDGTMTNCDVIVVNCDRELGGEPILTAYPNPFTDEIYVVIEDLQDTKFVIKIVDELGRTVYTQKCTSDNPYYQTTINLKDLKPAVYHINVVSESKVLNHRIIKK